MLIIMCISRDIPESWELKTETEKRCKQQNKKKVEKSQQQQQEEEYINII